MSEGLTQGDSSRTHRIYYNSNDDGTEGARRDYDDPPKQYRTTDAVRAAGREVMSAICPPSAAGSARYE